MIPLHCLKRLQRRCVGDTQPKDYTIFVFLRPPGRIGQSVAPRS
jgi:hypothetical protein